MCRFFLCLMLASLYSLAQVPQDPTPAPLSSTDNPYQKFVEYARLLRASPKNMSIWKALVQETQALPPTSDLKEASFAAAAIGAALNNENESALAWRDAARGLEGGSGEYQSMLSPESLGQGCPICSSSGKVAQSCIKCAGTGHCANDKCSEGLIKIYQYNTKTQKFENTQKRCPICKGAGACTECKGEKSLPATCKLCHGVGTNLDREKATAVLTRLLDVIEAKGGDYKTLAHEQAMVAKGYVKYKGQFISPEAYAKILKDEEAARLKAEADAAAATASQETARRRQIHDAVLLRLRTIMATDPAQAMQIADDHLAGQPERATDTKFQNMRSQAKLMVEAHKAEQEGNIDLAVQKMQAALACGHDERIAETIRKLQLNNIGL